MDDTAIFLVTHNLSYRVLVEITTNYDCTCMQSALHINSAQSILNLTIIYL